MKTIVLLCSSGISTSVLVQKNLQAATVCEGFDFEIFTDASLNASRWNHIADCILLAPHIHFQKDEISRQCPETPIDAIDMKTYGKADGLETLNLARRLMGI